MAEEPLVNAEEPLVNAVAPRAENDRVEALLTSRPGLGQRGFAELRESVGTFVTFNASMTGFFTLYSAVFLLLETTTGDGLLGNCDFYTQFLFAGGLAVGFSAAVADFLFDLSRLVTPIRHCYQVRNGAAEVLADPAEMEKDLELICLGKSSNCFGEAGNVDFTEYLVEVVGSVIIVICRLFSNLSLALLTVVLLCYNFFADSNIDSPSTVVVVNPNNSTSAILDGATQDSADCFIEEQALNYLLAYTALVAGVLLVIRAVVLPKWKYRGMDETSLRAVLQNMDEDARNDLVRALRPPAPPVD